MEQVLQGTSAHPHPRTTLSPNSRHLLLHRLGLKHQRIRPAFSPLPAMNKIRYAQRNSNPPPFCPFQSNWCTCALSSECVRRCMQSILCTVGLQPPTSIGHGSLGAYLPRLPDHAPPPPCPAPQPCPAPSALPQARPAPSPSPLRSFLGSWRAQSRLHGDADPMVPSSQHQADQELG